MLKTGILAAVTALCLMLPSTGANAVGCTPSKAEAAFVAKALQLTNVERRRKGLRPLRTDSRVQAAAQAHACDMMRRGYFSHRSKNGSTLGQRLRRQGCKFGYVGENIALGQPSPESVMRDWMASSGHRKNILLGHGVDRFGAGIAKYRNGYYWVMMFSQGC